MAARGLVFFGDAVSVSAGAAPSDFAVDSSELPSVARDSADPATLPCDGGSLEVAGAEAGAFEAEEAEAGVEVSDAGGCFAASVFSGSVVERSSCGVMVCESVVDAGGGSVGVCDDEFVVLDLPMIASTRCNASVARG